MNIADNFARLRSSIPEHVKVIAVTKLHPPDVIMEAYKVGHRHFGENRVHELTHKQPLLPNDIEWHFIGHLQTNKVKYILPVVSLIHSIDSLKLLAQVNKHANTLKRVVDCLLQFHIATEESKFGLDNAEARELLDSVEYKAMKSVRIRGVMGMATFTDNMDQVRKEFKALRQIFETIKKEYFSNEQTFSEISMGMSSDYQVAIEEGSTMVRIGTSIFGESK